MIFETFESPFCTNRPVSPEMFKGRHENVRDVLKYIPTVINQGRLYHFFITGKRGMGKTSFVKYVAKITEYKYNMFPVYSNNKRTNTIDELITKLLDKLFMEFKKTNKMIEFINFFFSRFEGTGIKSADFTFEQHPEIAVNVKYNFIEFLKDLCDNLKSYDGLFIIIDDVNGLSETPEFAN